MQITQACGHGRGERCEAQRKTDEVGVSGTEAIFGTWKHWETVVTRDQSPRRTAGHKATPPRRSCMTKCMSRSWSLNRCESGSHRPPDVPRRPQEQWALGSVRVYRESGDAGSPRGLRNLRGGRREPGSWVRTVQASLPIAPSLQTALDWTDLRLLRLDEEQTR